MRACFLNRIRIGTSSKWADGGHEIQRGYHASAMPDGEHFPEINSKQIHARSIRNIGHRLVGRFETCNENGCGSCVEYTTLLKHVWLPTAR